MNITLPLDRMTTEEKWAVIETIWADLAQNSPLRELSDVHHKILEERREAVASGRDVPMDLETFEKRARELKA